MQILEIEPGTETTNEVDVQVSTLDQEIAEMKIDPNGGLFVKIDVQGFEDKVIAGGQRTLASAQLVQVEMSLTSSYEGGARMPAVMDALEGLGFRCISLEPAFCDDKKREILEVDGLFAR